MDTDLLVIDVLESVIEPSPHDNNSPETKHQRQSSAINTRVFGDDIPYHEPTEILYKGNVMPESGTNLMDMLLTISKSGTRFMVIGLNYECRAFDSFKRLWRHLSRALRSRANVEDTDEAEIEPMWIDIQNPSNDDLTAMQHKFNLHPLTIEELMEDSFCIEKSEQFGDYCRILLKGLGVDHNTIRLNIIVFEDHIITVRDGPLEGLENVLYRLTSFEQNINNNIKRSILPNSNWPLHALIDAVIDTHMTHVDAAILESETIDELVVDLKPKERFDLISRIGYAKKNIGGLMRSMMVKRDVVLKMKSYRSHGIITVNSSTHLRDASERLSSAVERLEAALEGVQSAHAYTMAKIELDRKISREKIKVASRRAALGIATLSPFALVAGVWGMNSGGMPGFWQFGDAYLNHTWFMGICGLMLFIVFVLNVFARGRVIEISNTNRINVFSNLE
ncbi:hypothetical protein AKO1_006685 [Acrasis kona]|uniref:Magnesium transporter n=1 Tax=Acrasis kona TaxID=1008807 RepID=A0AAW2ZLJ8_9EUKA